jgi:hypothetical protein
MASARMIKSLTPEQYESIDGWTAARKVDITAPVIRKVKNGMVRVFCDFECRIPGVQCILRHDMLVTAEGRIFHQRGKEIKRRVG